MRNTIVDLRAFTMSEHFLDAEPEFITGNDVARRLSIPSSRFFRRVKSGELKPDTTVATGSAPLMLFKRSRLPAIAALFGMQTSTVTL
jgi:hypothetical protein